MDYDTLKEQWGDVEERDGIRLSWNTFPSSRMVILLRCRGMQLYLQTRSRKPRDSLYPSAHCTRR